MRWKDGVLLRLFDGAQEMRCAFFLDRGTKVREPRLTPRAGGANDRELLRRETCCLSLHIAPRHTGVHRVGAPGGGKGARRDTHLGRGPSKVGWPLLVPPLSRALSARRSGDCARQQSICSHSLKKKKKKTSVRPRTQAAHETERHTRAPRVASPLSASPHTDCQDRPVQTLRRGGAGSVTRAAPARNQAPLL